MKSVNKVTAYNWKQIMLSVQPSGDYIVKNVSSTESKVSVTAIETVLSDYVGKKKVKKIAKAIAEVVDTYNNADNVQITLVWKDGTKYCISDDESGEPKLVELKEENSNLKDELRSINKEYIDEEKIDEFLERAIEAITTVKANNNPAYMPKGFEYFDGAIESKDYRISDEEGNIFTWIPEKTLENGKHVKGFFVSTYEISKGANGAPKSIEGVKPWVNITQPKAEKMAKKIGGSLISNEQWDAICAHVAEVIDDFSVYEDSAEIGNYWNGPGSTRALEKTGKHVICGVSNLAGNCWTWTNESDVIRGGTYCDFGYINPMASRYITTLSRSYDIGFRIVL